MSAIAGFVNFDGAPASAELLHDMMRIVQHRGPDGIAHWLNDSVGLGHLQISPAVDLITNGKNPELSMLS